MELEPSGDEPSLTEQSFGPVVWPSAAKVAGLVVGVAWFLELLGFVFPGFLTRMAAASWILGGVCYVGIASFILARTFTRDFKEQTFLGWPALALAALLTFWGIGGPDLTTINPESCLQVSIGLDNLHEPDLALDRRGFLNYPCRQYTIAALPTAACGRSLLALQLGFAIPFFSGVLVFYAGLRASAGRMGGFSAALGVALLFCFTRVPTWIREYEQTILPLAFTLHVTGWWLLGRSHKLPAPAVGFGLAWLGGVLAMGYTPGLATVALMIVLAARATLFPPRPSALAGERFLASQLVAYLVVLAGIALWLQWGPQLGFGDPTRRPYGNEFGPRSFDFLKAIVLGRPDGGLIISWLQIPFLGFVLLALTGRLGAETRIVAVWAIASTIAAVYLRGWAQRPAAFDLHRAMIIVPPICAAASLWLTRLILHSGPPRPWISLLVRSGMSLGILVVAAHSIWFKPSGGWLDPPGPRVIDVLILDAWEYIWVHRISDDAAVEIQGSSEITPLNVPDYLRYFVPSARFQRGDKSVRSPTWRPTIVLSYLPLRRGETSPSVVRQDPNLSRRVLVARDRVKFIRTAENFPAPRSEIESR